MDRFPGLTLPTRRSEAAEARWTERAELESVNGCLSAAVAKLGRLYDESLTMPPRIELAVMKIERAQELIGLVMSELEDSSND